MDRGMSIQGSKADIKLIVPDFGQIEYSGNWDENFQAIQREFIRCARSILLSHELTYKGQRWLITALELYLYHSDFWPDTTTHFYRFKQRQQLERGTWYIHRGGTPAPNRSGIDITAGCENKEIAAGLLIAALGERPGSATACKIIIRSETGYSFRRNDTWSERDRSIIETINGRSIGQCALTLNGRESIRELWIGPRKLGKEQRNTEFGRRHLRIATFRTTNPPMKRLGD